MSFQKGHVGTRCPVPWHTYHHPSLSTLTAICLHRPLSSTVADSWSVQDRLRGYLNINKTPLVWFFYKEQRRKSKSRREASYHWKRWAWQSQTRAYKPSESSGLSTVPLHPSIHLAKPCWFSTFALSFYEHSLNTLGARGERPGVVSSERCPASDESVVNVHVSCFPDTFKYTKGTRLEWRPFEHDNWSFPFLIRTCRGLSFQVIVHNSL